MLAERYRLDAPLGRGGMGEVWRAWDERLGRPVAVKLMVPGAGREDLDSRFDAEARIAARLSDPHVVSVFDAGVCDDECFLVMELVEGRSLAEALHEDGPLTPDRAASVARQTAAGLDAAHRHGVVHRDIKPANLLLAPDGTVKIADFGIARCPSGDTTGQVTAISGTSLYLAPENALGRPAEPPADVYSLGCTLYELLTGRPPFEGEHALAVLCRHVEDTPASPCTLRPEIPGAFAAYVLRMLAKDPAERPAAREVADWFDGGTWRRGAPDLPPAPAAVPPRPARCSRRRRIPAVAAAVGTALTVTALAFISPLAQGGDPGRADVPPVTGPPSVLRATPAADTSDLPARRPASARHAARPFGPAAGPAAATRHARRDGGGRPDAHGR
ncbi:serine/threonine-protein kinase [Streptantibioticus silvisoli]|uniref:non-specific serine/threonine protein kinase n=1 Tax=Streptantibioticus silvisoli TaxID=2705255 RepID=A0ABT6VXW7_9ACTN|nr:serine/threonine-protein kinase [Streptantibioticus silvisoli]MDI5963331.1 serine/threonine-protein kinase [Streptantibioticus silvisoli]